MAKTIPLLTRVHNRSYYQEIMQFERMANQHNRGVDRCKLAQSMGVGAEGPISVSVLE